MLFCVNRYFCFRTIFEYFSLFCQIVYPFGFFVVFLVAISFFQIVRFLLHPILGMFSYHLPPFVDRTFFRCFGMSYFVPYYFTFRWYLFNLPSFASTFWFISSSCIVNFLCVAFSFLSLHVPVSFLFGMFSYIFFRVSSRISPLGFEFFFVLFEGIQIFPQSNFAHA